MSEVYPSRLCDTWYRLKHARIGPSLCCYTRYCANAPYENKFAFHSFRLLSSKFNKTAHGSKSTINVCICIKIIIPL